MASGTVIEPGASGQGVCVMDNVSSRLPTIGRLFFLQQSRLHHLARSRREQSEAVSGLYLAHGIFFASAFHTERRRIPGGNIYGAEHPWHTVYGHNQPYHEIAQ